MSDLIPDPTSSSNGLGRERERLLDIIKQHPGVVSATSSPSGKAREALQRRYCRALVEVAQVVSHPPAGAGKRLRGRVARAAEGLAELREITALMKTAG